MPRQARQKSETGIYHVILRGANRQEIFHDDEARTLTEKMLTGINIAQIKSLPKEQRDEIIRNAKEIEGLTQRQLARIVGVSQALLSIS